MLDLTNIQKPTLEVRLPKDDGESVTVHIYPATKKMIDKLHKQTKTPDELYAAAAEVLSINEDGVIFTADDLEELDLHVIMKLLEAYMNFIGNKVDKDPN